MAEMVGSAVIQEAVSRVSSFVLGKREDKESKGRIIERLEMALAELEFALERSVKLPITDISLLHRRKTESGCSLRYYTFCNPFVRQLLEGRTLGYRRMQGTQVHHCYVWPMCSEGRGVEAELQYHYEDHKMPEKGFRLALMLRLSESKDVVGIAVKCLLSLVSHFKIVTESAMGELSLLPNLLDISNSYAPSLIGIQPHYIRYSDIFRPDPVCCKAKGEGFCPSSSDLSHILPEPVMLPFNPPPPFWSPVRSFNFRCYISAKEYSLIRSTDDVNRLPLELVAAIVPHLVQEGLKESYACEVTGFKEQRRDGSIQEMTEMVRSQATNHFVREPELTDYGVLWISAHGCAYYGVQKINSEMRSVANADSRFKTQGVAKRRRRSCV
ncbi:hypothetical protein PVAP13_2KG076316 [Panicum virgatum]|uniref:Uncharacterized protein n=1 Tax=Panicum virgatum TaxID=38727 RepID=A0A8T0VXJ2_PANVG|nr:hypothetical protein PVAP13_2KG076316 [Panicum virgatum]